jgi:sialate O-acetylesterase
VECFRKSQSAVVAAPRSEDVSATNEIAAATNSANSSTNSSNVRRRRGNAAPRDPVQDQHNATVLFNGMIAPIMPYAIRGAIWYQGESIVGGNEGIELYPHVQATLVRNWRELWGEGDFPFYIVQLAGQEAASNKPEVREAQATVLQLPNTGMAVTMDIGEAKNVHPKNKQDVGDRVARIALAKVYGRQIEFSGPVYQSMKIGNNKIRIEFSHADGLVARDGPPIPCCTLVWTAGTMPSGGPVRVFDKRERNILSKGHRTPKRAALKKDAIFAELDFA